MLKLKFRQYGIYKKFINSSLIKTRNFSFSTDADWIIKTEKENEKEKELSDTEIKKIPKVNKANFHFSNRREINFLKEDELAFKRKEEYLKKEEELNKINSNESQNELELIEPIDHSNKIQENENNKNQNFGYFNSSEKNFKSKKKLFKKKI